jgi:imidazolonepropionase-like amidohydrolase
MPALHLRGIVLPQAELHDVFITTERKITFQPIQGARTVLNSGFLLPGLVDCHTHLAINSPATHGASAMEEVRASARAELAAGVLALREPGSPNRLSRDLGPAEGLPRVITAGMFLAPPGGYFPISRDATEGEVVAAAVEEVKDSGGWTKIIGDFPRASGHFETNYSASALKRVSEAVHAAGGRVAIHAVIPETIEAAVQAGFDSIEHGTMIEPALIDMMASRGIAWVPTLLISDEIRGFAAGMGITAEDCERINRSLDTLPALVARAASIGVRIFAGTDAGMVAHGQIVREIELLHAGGLEAGAVLGAASWEARDFLGLSGIEEGAPADIVAYASDPRTDLRTLRHPVLRILDGVEIA